MLTQIPLTLINFYLLFLICRVYKLLKLLVHKILFAASYLSEYGISCIDLIIIYRQLNNLKLFEKIYLDLQIHCLVKFSYSYRYNLQLIQFQSIHILFFINSRLIFNEIIEVEEYILNQELIKISI